MMAKFTKGKASAFFLLSGVGLILCGILFLLGIDILGTVGTDNVSKNGWVFALICFIIGIPFTFIGYMLLQYIWRSERQSGRRFIWEKS